MAKQAAQPPPIITPHSYQQRDQCQLREQYKCDLIFQRAPYLREPKKSNDTNASNALIRYV